MLVRHCIWTKSFPTSRLSLSRSLPLVYRIPLWRQLSDSLDRFNHDGNRPDRSSYFSKFSSRIFTLPNVITGSRIAFTPIISYWMVSGQHQAALAGFIAAAVSDFADGWIAKHYNDKSVLGTYLDPFADKFLIGTMAITLTHIHVLAPWAVTIVVGRDVLLILGTAFIRYQTMDRRSLSLVSFFDVASFPTHEVHPSRLSKANTVMQVAWVSVGMLSMSFSVPDLPFISLMTYGVAATTVASGADYLINSSKFLRRMKARTNNKPLS